LGRRLNKGLQAIMRMAEMYGDQDTRTFEERRAEVVAIVRSAADFEGTDSGLRKIFLVMSEADNEKEFDEAFTTLVSSLSENTTRYLHSV
jgi:hypothetical protein